MNNDDLYIGSFKRQLIGIIDIVVIGIALSLIFGESESSRIITIEFILLLSYFVLMGYYMEATLAQKLFKLKLVDAHSGNKPTIKQLALRELYFLTTLTGIGYFIAMFTHSYYSGFYWDRWSNVKVIPVRANLAEFNKQLEVAMKSGS